jgi:broad specificity phosphatase PhoE
MDVYFVRHGESEHNAGFSTSTDSPLTPLGREQARSTGKRLAGLGLEALYCSPQLRALETAEILRAYLDLQPQVCLQLSERCFCWDEPGLPRSEILHQFPNHILPAEVDEEGWARHWSHETREQLYERVKPVATAITELAMANVVGTIGIVIHGGCGDMLLHHLLGVPLTASVRFHHDNCGLTLLRFEEDCQLKLVFLNNTAHLAALTKRL